MVIETIESDRKKALSLVEEKNFNSLIVFLILLDSWILGALASPMVKAYLGLELFVLDRLIVAIFICEMMIKIYAYGGSFFKSKGNILELLVVVISIVPSVSYFVVLRSFRLLRLVRFIDKNSKIAQFLSVMRKSLASFVSAVIVFSIFLYVFAILGTSFFGKVFLEFASLQDTTYLLVQLLLLQSSAFEEMYFVLLRYSWAWIYFASYILMSLFLMVSCISASLKNVLLAEKES